MDQVVLHRALCLAALLLPLHAAVAQQQPLAVVTGDEPFDAFGAALRNAGDVNGDGTDDYVVGAPKADPGGDRSGQAWVFSGADHATLHVLLGTAPLHEFGSAVDGAGDVNADGYTDLIVGEPWPYGTSNAPGAAYVYSGSDGSLLMTLVGQEVGDLFGIAVSGLGDIDGDGHDDVAVAAPNDAGALGSDDGRIAIYSGSDGSLLREIAGWTTNMRLGRSLGRAGDFDGDGVADLVAGAPGWKPSGVLSVGGVFVLSGATGAVLATGAGTVNDGTLGNDSGMLGDVDGDGTADLFGSAQERLMVWSGANGAVLHNLKCFTRNWDVPCATGLGDLDGDGHADFLLGDPEASDLALFAGLATVRSGADASVLMTLRGAAHYGKLTSSTAMLGDRDGNGRPEFLLGQTLDGSVSAGQVLLQEYEGLDPHLQIVGTDSPSAGFGTVVRSAGDVDNDGWPDVIAGEPDDSTAADSAGRATVYSGRDGSVLHIFFGSAKYRHLGFAVDAAGDLNADGFADVIVGAPFGQVPAHGEVLVYSGRDGSVLHLFQGHSPSDRFGYSVAGVGDVDGDWRPDLFIGAPFDDVGLPDNGSARLYSGATGQQIALLAGDAGNVLLGHVVGGGGDVDADGVPDLIARIPNEPVPLLGYPGVVKVFSGATSAPILTLTGEVNGSLFGAALDDTGDVDGDGHDDLVIGAPNYAPSSSLLGRAYVFSGATGQLLFMHSPIQASQEAGTSVAGAGDVNGDGVPDVLVGVPKATLLASKEGEVRLLSGVDGALIQAWSSFVKDGQLGAEVDALGDADFDGRPDFVAGAVRAAGQVDGEVVIWVSGDGSSPWANLGGVLPGAHGAPRLFPSGTLQAGESVTLSLTGAAAAAPLLLVAGLGELGLPFKGGTLVPQPDFLISGLATDGSGELTLVAAWPSGFVAGVSVYLQTWILDPSGPAGFAASNGVRGTVP